MFFKNIAVILQCRNYIKNIKRTTSSVFDTLNDKKALYKLPCCVNTSVLYR